MLGQQDASFTVIPFLQTDQGEIIILKGGDLSGDVGTTIRAGSAKQIVWRYTPADSEIWKYQMGVIVDDHTKVDLKELLTQVDSNNIRKHLQELSVKRHFTNGRENLETIKLYLESAFRMGHLRTQRQRFNFNAYKADNVIGQLDGIMAGKGKIVLGAHFDAVKGSWGGDDNASGVAGMLEVMRVLSKYRLNNDVAFVGFDQEEAGMLGSKFYVSALGEHKNIDYMINFDMIGCYMDKVGSQPFPEGLKEGFPVAYKKVADNHFKGDFILLVANEQSAEMVAAFEQASSENVATLAVVSLVVPDDGRFAPEYFRASDFVSFWDAGFKALSIGDTGDVRNSNYHSPRDVYRTVNVSFVYDVVKATIAAIADMGGIRNVVSQTCNVKML
ncbi:M20/M25/M40 family metallo-hydrolase [Chitinophaga pendula]|uniref:M20/M25/M40 family metallo-hydrolase n=1 Tax=Chitinophaga TaxID=79328 RepID=UPI0012FD22DE|nr:MULTISPECIES: M20/M25/M40 family metallo-hydrolase [Chitinophaga]UCJ09082.1 M20/M25/M40 family metallo-hydrolase [Chitinophaga pendula]